MTPVPQSRASEAAIEHAAVRRFGESLPNATVVQVVEMWRCVSQGVRDAYLQLATNTLAVAHDPALGLDRSVCLRDVVEALRGLGQQHDRPTYGNPGYRCETAAEYIERTFTASSSSEGSPDGD